MKITKEKITKEIEEIEIDLPFYSKQDTWLYCILKENDTIRTSVSFDGSAAWVSRLDTKSMMQEALRGEPITADEFDKVFSAACNIISGKSKLAIENERLCEEVKHNAKTNGNPNL